MYLIDNGLDERLHMLSVQLPSDFDHDFRDKVGRTPYTACLNNFDRVLSVLTFLKTSMDFPDSLGRVPLAAFLQIKGHLRAHHLGVGDIMFYLREMKKPSAAYDHKKRNLLHFYCGFFGEDDPRPVERMLDLGVSGRAQDHYGKRPVDLAAARSMPKIVRTFLLRGIVPNRQFFADAAPSTRAMIATALALERQTFFEFWVLQELAKVTPELTDVLMANVKPYLQFVCRIERVLGRMDAYIEFVLSKRPSKRMRTNSAGQYGRKMAISSQ
jgi:hypothetical protein